MLRVMKLPIFSFEGYDLIVFEKPEHAESFVEPAFVDLGSSYDADGQLILFETDGRITRIRQTGELQPESLRAALLATLSQVGASASPNADLDELKRHVEERFRYAPPRTVLQWLRDRLKGHS
jgi:hypothetical protein